MRITDEQARIELARIKREGAGGPPQPDPLAGSLDQIQKSLKMKADLAAAQAASSTGDYAFDDARERAYKNADWNR
ncbi:hypothetical protein [Mesorhizobium sp. M0037]|uniref:hypothetical protein n=1 Tax=unclassified Mesorhizobium TaxID=325217 RepID=UPI00333C3242